ncbi:MAG: DUF2235 domain-containing protein [Oricola sp.]
MPKNIVILCDGTSNQIEEQRSNILRLYGCLRRNDEQIVFYDPGVGTFGGEDDWLRWTRQAKEVWGLATGWGLDRNVREAYRFLVEHFDPGDPGKGIPQDTIFIFGFSRGAYTARVLAGFIHALGIIDRTQLNLASYAYRAYKQIGRKERPAGGLGSDNSAFTDMRLHERALKTFRPKIKALGLFDTVASVIEHGPVFPQLRTLPFTTTNPSVEHVRHAVAIDERRTMFNPLLWPAGGEYWGSPFRPGDAKVKPQDVKEVWFSGVHGDVGGGYGEKNSAQAKIPLAWMIDEMEAPELGLKFIPQTVRRVVLGEDPKHPEYVRPGVYQDLNRSMTAAWRAVEALPRRIPATSFRERGRKGCYFPLCDRRLIPPGAIIHASVHERMDSDKNYRPVNLPRPGRSD